MGLSNSPASLFLCAVPVGKFAGRTATARSRYRRLIDRCPKVVQILSLKDIASFLNITPSYLSTLRKEMTYETRAEGKRACTMLRKKE